MNSQTTISGPHWAVSTKLVKQWPVPIKQSWLTALQIHLLVEHSSQNWTINNLAI